MLGYNAANSISCWPYSSRWPNPTSPYSFLNYIKQKGKSILLYPWRFSCCAMNITSIVNGLSASWIIWDSIPMYSRFILMQSRNFISFNVPPRWPEKRFLTLPENLRRGYQAAYIPESCRHIRNHVVHSSAYLSNKTSIQEKKKLLLSGADKVLLKFSTICYKKRIHSDVGCTGLLSLQDFTLMEYSKLTLEMTSPNCVDYFYQLPRHKKMRWTSSEASLQSINQDLINDIFNLIYAKMSLTISK